MRARCSYRFEEDSYNHADRARWNSLTIDVAEMMIASEYDYGPVMETCLRMFRMLGMVRKVLVATKEQAEPDESRQNTHFPSQPQRALNSFTSITFFYFCTASAMILSKVAPPGTRL